MTAEASTVGESSYAQQEDERYVYDQISDKETMDDPRIVWVLERIMAYCQTEDMNLVVRMLKKHDHRALKKLYRLMNEAGSDYKHGFFVYQTQFTRRFKKNVRFMKIHVREGDERPYRCSVATEVRQREETFMQLHLHFGLHRWERFPHQGKLIYFLPRLKTCERFETLREAQAMMPKMFYIGQIDIAGVKNFRTLVAALQQYLKSLFLNPVNPLALKSAVPSVLVKTCVELKRPSIFEIENSSSYMRKYVDIEKFLISEDVPVFPNFNLQLYKRLESYGMTKRREKFNIYTIDDFLNPEVFARNPKIRSLWYKKKKGPIPKFRDRAQSALTDMSPPKSKMLSSMQKLLEDFDWCLSKVSQCTLNVLFTDFLAKLDLHKFDKDPELLVVHMAFLEGVLEIWNLHIKNLLKFCTIQTIKGKGVLALYEFYRERRDKMSNLIFEMFHPIVENLLTFVARHSKTLLVKEFREIRCQLENFYIICWDTCEYLEFCLNELEIIHNHKMLRSIIPCARQFLDVLKMLLTLSYYWKSNNRFLDVLNRLHYIIQSKIERVLNTENLFKLPNRIAIALCKDVISVSDFWQSTVEQDRAFSQKINFEKLTHLRNVAKSIMSILVVMKSYNHVFCQQCYDAENENYQLDAVVYQVSQLIEPVLSPNFDYLDVDNKVLWDELVNGFKDRCNAFDKEASLLIIDAIKKTKSTRNITHILTHFKRSTKMFKMDSLFNDIFSNLDISPQFSAEILHILEIFLKASYYKDSMRSFGYASKSMQWTRCLFYVVQKNLSILFSVGAILSNVYEKVITNYLRCVDIFTSYEVGLYKVWLKRFVNYTHNVVSRKLIQLAYDKEVGGNADDGCQGLLDPNFFLKFPLAGWDTVAPQGDEGNCQVSSKEICKYLPQFRPYLMDAFVEGHVEKLASLHSMSSGQEDEDGDDEIDQDDAYKKNLLIKYNMDLDNWYEERYMLNYNFVTRLALGMCSQNDEQLEANVYFLLEQILKRFIHEDDKVARKRSLVSEGVDYFQTYDCNSSSGSVTRVSELLTEDTKSVGTSDLGKEEANRFIVDRDTSFIKNFTELKYLKAEKTEDVPLFIGIRQNFKEKINRLLGGDMVATKDMFVAKTEEVLAEDPVSECSENFAPPDKGAPVPKVKIPNPLEMDDLTKYKVLFKTPINNLFNYKELGFVLWLNSTKMRFVKPSEETHNRLPAAQEPQGPSAFICDCGVNVDMRVGKCPDCNFDWLNFNLSTLLNEDCDSKKVSVEDSGGSIHKLAEGTDPKIRMKRSFRRAPAEKYETPMNDIFVEEENADKLFRKKFNIYLAKLINDSNLPGEAIGPTEISGRVRGEVNAEGKFDSKSAFLYEVTDDDMPDQKIAHEINVITEVQRAFSRTNRGRFKKELQEAIRQAEDDGSESEKAMQALEYDNEIRKAVPGIYTGCKHSLNKMNWTNFIGGDILREHGYTIQANREPFTYIACRDIETLEEFGFNLPSETLAFAFNNFDRNKHDIFEIVTMYKGIIGKFSDAKLMALKKYIRPVERNICQGLNFCGLRTLNISKQCQELIVQMNTLVIVEVLMSEIEGSISATLNTIGRLNFYRLPSVKAYSVKEFFNTVNRNCVRTQRRLNRLNKLIPKKLLKLETLLFQERTGKCEYLITYYRCVEKTLFKKLIDMVKANFNIFRKFVLGELKCRFFVVASVSEPSVCVTPELKQVNQQLRSLAERIIKFQLQMPRWFDGTCSKVPHLKKKNVAFKTTHMYSFAEDLLGSEEVVLQLQTSYECLSFVLDAVDDYIYQWGRFEHLWVEDLEDIFSKFSYEVPSLQDYFDVFSFYHQIIVEIYRMPDQVDIYCVRVKIKEIKKKVLMWALSWRILTRRSIGESFVLESQALFSRMRVIWENMAVRVTTFHTLRQVLRAAYMFGKLECAAEAVLNSITAKNSLAKLWIPQHIYEESNVRNIIVFNLKQLKTLAMYRRELLAPYLSRMTPRFECIQCSPSGLISDVKRSQSEFPKLFTAALKEPLFGAQLARLVSQRVAEMEDINWTCPWSVVRLVMDHLSQGVKIIEWLRMLYPKLTVNRLSSTKKILELLNMNVKLEEKSEPSLEMLLKSLK